MGAYNRKGISMNNEDLNPLWDIYDVTQRVEWNLASYLRTELVERHEYLLADGGENHSTELAELNHVLAQVQPIDAHVELVSEQHVAEYCLNFVDSLFCASDATVAKYFDIKAVANKVHADMQKVQIGNIVYYAMARPYLAPY